MPFVRILVIKLNHFTSQLIAETLHFLLTSNIYWPQPVLIVLRNLWGKTNSVGNRFSFFHGVTKNFQRVTSNAMNFNTLWRWKSKFLKAHHADWLSCDLTVSHFTDEEWSSNQNINGAISCHLRDSCTYFFNAWLAVMHWIKFWCIVVIPDWDAYSSNIVHLSDTLVANSERMPSI